MNALVELFRYLTVAFSARLGNILFVNKRGGFAPFSHLMAAMAVDAIGSITVATQQRRTVNALFIRRNKSRRRGSAHPNIRIIKMTGKTKLLLCNLLCQGIMSCIARGNAVPMAGQAIRCPRYPRRKSPPVRGLKVTVLDVPMALAARSRHLRLMEFGIGQLRRDDVVRAVTILTGDIWFMVSGNGRSKLRMKRVLERDIVMARQTIDGLDFRFVWKIFEFKAGMAGNADEFLMGGLIEYGFVDKKRNLFPLIFFR
jgi:hypothetical protein